MAANEELPCNGEEYARESHKCWACLSLEIAFPSCAMMRLSDSRVSRNVEEIRTIETGCGFQEERRGILVTGSRAEGLALQDCWGQKPADIDFMVLYGGSWGVTMPQRQYESNEVGSCDSSIKKRNSSLLFDNKKCAAGFARVRVEGDQQLIAANMGLTLRGNGKASALVQQCFINHESQTWLSSGGIMKVLQGSHVDSVDIRGPARKIGGGIRDWVPALICSDPPLEMAQFLERKRYSIWPKRETLERMQHLPLVLVLTGHKSSPLHHLEYRYSWSIPEMLLAWDMPVWIKQGYWAFKYVLNHQLESARLASHETNGCESLQEGHVDGRSMCGSYHWKTVLLWELEQPGTWECQCPYRLFHRLLWRLSSHLGEDTHPCILPHYFLSQCNLFECVSDEDLQLTLQCVRYIQKHPGEVIPGAVFFTEEVLGPSVERYDFESLLKTLITSGVLTASNEQRAFSENMLNLVEEHRQGKYKLQKLDDERSFYSWISNRIELHNILEIYRRLARSSV